MNTENIIMDAPETVVPEIRERGRQESKKYFKKNYIYKDRWLRVRLVIQLGFLGICLWIGWEFLDFTSALRADAFVSIDQRPPGVEGFLPISSLMELWLFIKSGIFLNIHPAGVIILSAVIVSSLLLRRGFCSWLCPVGTISEALTRLGIKFGVSIKPYRWLDYVFRCIKYFLLAFFLYAVFGMSADSLVTFLTGDYNKASDIKMLDFFADPTRMTLSVIGILALLTLMIKNFWCRYLCPYGALVGILSRFSPSSIRRDKATCIDCGRCDNACPSYLPVASSAKIRSEECLACLQCSAVCPVENCLEFSTPKKKIRLSPVIYSIMFLIIVLGSIMAAKSFGLWQGKTTIEEYRDLAKRTEFLGHPRNIDGY